MSLVEHVNRNKNGLTKMQIQIPISTRAGMAELSKRLGISQLAIVRSEPVKESPIISKDIDK